MGRRKRDKSNSRGDNKIGRPENLGKLEERVKHGGGWSSSSSVSASG